jgi:methyl-accepting chemotaxis protein
MGQLTIKHKMTLLAILSALGFITLISFNYMEINALNNLNGVSLQSASLNSQMLMLRRHEKDFIARKDLKYVEKYAKVMKHFNSTLTTLARNVTVLTLPDSDISKLRKIINNYNEQFLRLVEQQKTIGFHPKDGLYGSLRNEVHKIESLLKQQEQQTGASEQVHSLMRTMLMLRRHEKDFMLRRDAKYIDKFTQRSDIMRNKLTQAELEQDFRDNALQALEIYNEQFLALVSAEQTLGLDSKQGVLGAMRKIIHQSELLLKQFHQQIGVATTDNIQHKKMLSIFTGILLALIVMLMIISISKTITRRIRQLSNTMSDASKHKDLSTRVSLSGDDEIARMAKIYNEMMMEFDELMREIQASSLELGDVSNQLKASTEQTSKGVEQQLISSEHVVTSMNQVSATASEVSTNASQAAQASMEAEQAADIGHQLVVENGASFEKLADEIEKSRTIINRLSEESNNIDAMLNDIRGIADQTNLLALNAAIEAARAGEQGRGFAVVSDEVRVLAQRSAQSTQEIESVVSQLQVLAGQAVAAMQLGSIQAKQSIESTNTVKESLKNIKKSSETVNDMNAQIATVAEQQRVVAQEINLNVIAITDTAKETAKLTETVSASGIQVHTLSTQLGQRVLKFKLSS